MKRQSKISAAHARVAANNRDGFILLVVLLVIILMSLAAYAYTELMVSESGAANMYTRGVQTRIYSDSGIEYVASTIGNRTLEAGENLYHDPENFRQVLMGESNDDPYGTGRFTIITANERDPSFTMVRNGLANESGKLNINSLLSLGLEDDELHDLILEMPQMTDESVDCLLDWLDEDDEPRTFGAEAEDGYAPTNGPITSMEELLQVRGIEPEMLYGEDFNRNGLLDPNENDGSEKEPPDNADGILDLGLSSYFTIYSREVNTRADGSARIFVNDYILSDLYDEIAEEIDEDTAKFIVAYRMFGCDHAASNEDATLSEEMERFLAGIAQGIAGNNDEEGRVTRGGIDLTDPPEFVFRSVFDMIDAEVPAVIDGAMVTINSPWTSASMADDLPQLYELFSMIEDVEILGRVDPNQARKEVLLTIPAEEMTVELAEAIAASSMIDGSGNPLENLIYQRATPGWLVLEGLVDMPTMRTLAQYFTTRGGVFRTQVVGHFDEGGPISRVEVVIDGTEYPARVKYIRDLTNLGKGYHRDQLFGESAQ